jgi:uncharacterized protein
MTTHTGRISGVLAAGLAAYLLICVLAFLLQRHFIYFPLRWSEAEERRWNPGYEEVRLLAVDGERLHGWLHRNKDAPWTVLIFHGNAGNLSFHHLAMAPFEEMGLQVLLFDYRGYGLSTGAPTEDGLLLDGEAAADYLQKDLGVPPGRTVYFGQSLGSGVAALLAVRRPPARLILLSAFDSLPAVARQHYFFLPAGFLMRDRFDAAAVVGRISCPILFLHPGRDEIIPVSRGRALFDRAVSPKQFVLIPGALHNDISFPPGSIQQESLRKFLDLAPRAPSR